MVGVKWVILCPSAKQSRADKSELASRCVGDQRFIEHRVNVWLREIRRPAASSLLRAQTFVGELDAPISSHSHQAAWSAFQSSVAAQCRTIDQPQFRASPITHALGRPCLRELGIRLRTCRIAASRLGAHFTDLLCRSEWPLTRKISSCLEGE